MCWQLMFLFLITDACPTVADSSAADIAVALSSPQLEEHMSLERAGADSISIESDSVKFSLLENNAPVNGGVRSEVAVNYPFKLGDRIRYEFEFMFPNDFLADDGKRWWVIAQWHDQPNIAEGGSWKNFPGRAPPVSLYVEERDGVLGTGVNYYITGEKSWSPINRGEWNKVRFELLWLNNADGELRFFLNQEDLRRFAGPNMHNNYAHYLKIGMYRHPEIATNSAVFFKNLNVERLLP